MDFFLKTLENYCVNVVLCCVLSIIYFCSIYTSTLFYFCYIYTSTLFYFCYIYTSTLFYN